MTIDAFVAARTAVSIPKPAVLRRPARPAAQPSALLVATQRWVSSALLAKSLRAAGFHVEAVCRAGHPLCLLSEPLARHRLGQFDEDHSIAAAIRQMAPDLVIPCDDPAVDILHRLHEQDGDGPIAGVIERSIGHPTGYAIVKNKSALLELARTEGLSAPRSVPVDSFGHLLGLLDATGCPQVLKRDRTWSGTGVRIIANRDDARSAWSNVAGSMSVLRAMRSAQCNMRVKTLIERYRHASARIELQEFVAGAPANRAVVCADGKVLAGATVVALETVDPTGPASVVDVIDQPEIAQTVAVLVQRLRLSGFFGFDFIITPAGRAVLLEANPRATPIAHLPFMNGTSLPAALYEHVTGRAVVPDGGVIGCNRIALYPNEWNRDPASSYLREAFHAVPWDEPALMRAIMRSGSGLKLSQSEPAARAVPKRTASA